MSEILAPAGDAQSFYAALNAGADAIYLGLTDFSARKSAENFTLSNLSQFTDRAHLFGVKVYITINTLVTDDEMPRFLDLVKTCVLAKADAFIVQDFGCAYLLKNLFPNIELHASTQMGIHNVDGARFAKSLGFSRVVLSREATLQDIIQIKQETGLEIEYFVQGALCVAFSGNCYFSALEHNQSGNRGKCLQLCRLPYTAYLDNKNVGSGYLLSARDLCLMPNIEELINAGVDSFKIEGRLRRAGYVAQSVASYRSAIDSLSQNKQFDLNSEIDKLKRVFSRGEFNYSAYLNNNDNSKIAVVASGYDTASQGTVNIDLQGTTGNFIHGSVIAGQYGVVNINSNLPEGVSTLSRTGEVNKGSIAVYGNVMAGNNGELNLDLGEGGYLSGRVDDYQDAAVNGKHEEFFNPEFSNKITDSGIVNLTMGKGSTWDVTGQSWVTKLEGSGTIDMRNGGVNDTSHAVHIGELSGSHTFVMDLDTNHA